MIIRTIFPGRILARISILPKISIGFGFVCVCRPIDDDIGSLGRTLEDFKADFKPDDLRLVACVFFFVQKILLCGVITIIYLLPIETERRRTQSNMFEIYDT